MTNGSLMDIKSIAECSHWSILRYFFLEWSFYTGFTVHPHREDIGKSVQMSLLLDNAASTKILQMSIKQYYKHDKCFANQQFGLFQYIRDCIATEKIPQLMLLTKENVYSTLPDNIFHMPAYVQKG